MEENSSNVINPFSNAGNRSNVGNRRFPTMSGGIRKDRFDLYQFKNMLECFGFPFLPKGMNFRSFEDFVSFFRLKNVNIKYVSGDVRQFPSQGLGQLMSFAEKWNILLAFSLMFSYVEIRIRKAKVNVNGKWKFEFYSYLFVPENELEEFLNGKFFISHAISENQVVCCGGFSKLSSENNCRFPMEGFNSVGRAKLLVLFFYFPYNSAELSLDCRTGEVVFESYKSMVKKFMEVGFDEFSVRVVLQFMM